MGSQRQELLELLNELGEHYPAWRFGQLVENVSVWAGGDRPGIIGEVSDEQMIKAAREHLSSRLHSPVEAGTV